MKEKDKLSSDALKSISPFEKKSCYDCIFIKSALNLYCSNKDAIRDRGTSIPGCIKCPHWKPDWTYIPNDYKTEEYGYIDTKTKIKNMVNSVKDGIIIFFKGMISTERKK